MAPRPGESLAQYDAGIRRAVAVVPTDGADLTSGPTRGLFVGVSGNVAVNFCDDTDAATVTMLSLAAGVWHPLQVRRVLATGTTATSILAGY